MKGWILKCAQVDLAVWSRARVADRRRVTPTDILRLTQRLSNNILL